MKNHLLTTLLALLLPLALFAQDLSEQMKNEMVDDWKRAKAYTLEFIEAMPDDKVNFKATEEIRSFAEQILHMSQGTIGLTANGTGAEPIYSDVNLEQQEDFKNKESLMKIAAEAYDFAIESIGNMDMTTASEIVSRGPFNVSRIGWVRKGFEHQTHHRGQCVIYLRLSGATPPNAKLF